MNVGENIRYLRAQKGISQEDLAAALGYKSYTTITKWESGVSEPTLKMVNQIANYFHVSVNDLCYKRFSAEPDFAPAPDPTFERLRSDYESLNEEGRQKMVEFSDVLVASGMYGKNILSGVS